MLTKLLQEFLKLLICTFISALQISVTIPIIMQELEGRHTPPFFECYYQLQYIIIPNMYFPNITQLPPTMNSFNDIPAQLSFHSERALHQQHTVRRLINELLAEIEPFNTQAIVTCASARLRHVAMELTSLKIEVCIGSQFVHQDQHACTQITHLRLLALALSLRNQFSRNAQEDVQIEDFVSGLTGHIEKYRQQYVEQVVSETYLSLFRVCMFMIIDIIAAAL